MIPDETQQKTFRLFTYGIQPRIINRSFGIGFYVQGSLSKCSMISVLVTLLVFSIEFEIFKE